MDYKKMKPIGLVRLMLTDGVITREQAAKYFPELAESEDEKILKDIINFIKVSKPEWQNYRDYSSWIAWLEKRGEQKSVPDWMTKFLDELRTKKNYFDWDEHKDIEGGILAIINWMNPTYFNEKEGGQEPIEWSGKIGVKHAEGKLKEMLDRKENSAWSEEDENKLNEILLDIELSRAIHLHSPKGTFDSRKKWLKSIKDRVQPQPKQEWSEEDETIKERIIDELKEKKIIGVLGKSSYDIIENWLESIRPQSHWKPSEEMLEALYRALPQDVKEISEDEILLDKLYQGLKYGRVISNNKK